MVYFLCFRFQEIATVVITNNRVMAHAVGKNFFIGRKERQGDFDDFDDNAYVLLFYQIFRKIFSVFSDHKQKSNLPIIIFGHLWIM